MISAGLSSPALCESPETQFLRLTLQRDAYRYSLDIFWELWASQLGVRFDPSKNTTQFLFWAPYFIGKSVKLIVWTRQSQAQSVVYDRESIDLSTFSGNLGVPEGLFFVVLDNIVACNSVFPTHMYELEVDGERLSDMLGRYFPFGAQGPAAIINDDFSWTDTVFLKMQNTDPSLILKLHVGISSEEGTFSGLLHQFAVNVDLSDYDAVEFLPVGEFPGKTRYVLTRVNNQLTVVEDLHGHCPINWGYDGGPNYIASLSHAYGTPNDLKSLINALHNKGIKVGFDIQINHFGPEDVVNHRFGPWLSASNTAWGPRPNFRHPVIRKVLLGQIRNMVEIYHVDYLRLDMSSRYDDDLLIKDIHELKPCIELHNETYQLKRVVSRRLPIILEDERDWHDWLFDVAKVSAQWGFNLAHQMRDFIAGTHSNGSLIMSGIENSAKFVVFSNTHDEMGNLSGRPIISDLMNSLLMMSRGIPMHWLSGGFFHFFTNYSSAVNQANVVSEKCGVFLTLDAHHWEKMFPLHPCFVTLAKAKVYFKRLHVAWQKEVKPYSGLMWAQAETNIQKWFSSKRFPNLEAIIYAYGYAMFILSKISTLPLKEIDHDFFQKLRQLRRRYAWLHASRFLGDFFAFDAKSQALFCRRINPLNPHHQLYLIATQHLPLNVALKLAAGLWKVIATTEASQEDYAYKTDGNSFVMISLPKQCIIILERSVVFADASPADHLFKNLISIDKEPSDALFRDDLFTVEGWLKQREKAGIFFYNQQQFFFGFAPNLFVLITLIPMSGIEDIYVVQIANAHRRIPVSLIEREVAGSHYVYTLDLAKESINGSNSTVLKIVFFPLNTVVITIPK